MGWKLERRNVPSDSDSPVSANWCPKLRRTSRMPRSGGLGSRESPQAGGGDPPGALRAPWAWPSTVATLPLASSSPDRDSRQGKGGCPPFPFNVRPTPDSDSPSPSPGRTPNASAISGMMPGRALHAVPQACAAERPAGTACQRRAGQRTGRSDLRRARRDGGCPQARRRPAGPARAALLNAPGAPLSKALSKAASKSRTAQ